MKGGVLQQLGTPQEVYNKPANTFVAGFMGSPRMNLAKARLVSTGSGVALDIKVGDRPRALIELPSVPAALHDYVGKEVIAGIRPEAISLAREGMVCGPSQRFIDARIEVIEPTGSDTLVVFNLGGQEFTSRLDPDVVLSPGRRPASSST